MKVLVSVFAFICVVFFAVADLKGGGYAIHYVSAKLAYEQLTPTTKSKVDSLLRSMKEEIEAARVLGKGPYLDKLGETTDFEFGAIWADIVKKKIPERKHTSSFHYINLSLDSTGYKDSDDPDGMFVVANIDRCITVLMAAADQADCTTRVSNPDAVKSLNALTGVENAKNAEALLLLMHLIGDLCSNPLHVVSTDNKGGNTIQVRIEKSDGSTFGTNFHAAWDSGIFESNPQFDTPQKLYERIRSVNPINATYGSSWDHREWVKEQILIGRKIHINPITGERIKSGDTIGSRYKTEYFGYNVILTARAGLRIAHVLNDIFDPQYKR